MLLTWKALLYYVLPSILTAKNYISTVLFLVYSTGKYVFHDVLWFHNIFIFIVFDLALGNVHNCCEEN